MHMATRLKEIHVNKVSLVPSGAHPEADVAIFKSDDSDEFVVVSDPANLALITNNTNDDEIFEKMDPTSTDVHVDVPLGAKQKKKKSEAQMAKAKEAETEVEKTDEISEDDAKANLRKDATEVDFDALPEDVKKYIETLEDVVVQTVNKAVSEETPVPETETKVEKAEEAPVEPEAPVAKAEETEEDLLKTADPRIVELVRKAQEEAADATKIAKAERDLRVERELIAKADTYTVPGDKASVVKILKAATATGDASLLAEIEKTFAATTEAMKSSDIFKEFGTDATAAPTSGLEKVAKSIQEANPTLSHDEAVSKALEADPSLYESFLAEKKGQ